MMRSFPEYREMIRREVERNLPEEFAGYEVRAFRVSEMYKNRDVLKLVPPKGGKDRMEAAIFLEHIYTNYRVSLDLVAVLDITFQLLRETLERNKQMTKANIILCLVDVEGYENVLDAYPHRDFHGLSVLYRLYDGLPERNRYPNFITNEMAEYFGLTEEQLYEAALINTRKWHEPKIMTIGESFFKMIKESTIDKEIRDGLPESLKEEDELYVLSNDMRFNAAAYILYEDVLDKIGARIGSDYFLIPSTVYDVEIMPAIDGRPRNVQCMLLESRPDGMELGELLTSKIYFYDRTKKTLILYNMEKEA